MKDFRAVLGIRPSFILFFAAFILGGCATSHVMPAPPPRTAVYKFTLIEPVHAENSTFEDSSVRISFDIDPYQIRFSVGNKTGAPVKLNWNNVSYIDTEGVSHRVVHTGVSLADKAVSVPPTLIPPGTKLQEIMFPADYIGYDTGTYQGWTNTPLLPDEINLAENYQGKQVEIFMPLEINGRIHNYRFTFSISVS